MILESLHIKNWRKLGNVDVRALSPGVTVIHAPNKTGKTSMVEALRWTLIDLDYDTSRTGPVVPWDTNLVPEVKVVFAVGGQSYLLTKRFTKRKEGGAELYRVLRDAERRELIAKDKDVTAKTRELIGAGKSDRGIPQLLWVEQGVIDLPKIDEDLDKVLRPVLGSVISGRDVEFRQALWGRMQQWFTNEQNAARSKHRKGSRLKEIEEVIAEGKQEVNDMNAEFQRIQDLLAEVDRKEQQIAEVEAQVAAASREAEALKKADQELTGRRSKVRELRSGVETSERELSELKEALKKCREYEKAVGNLTEQVVETQRELSPLVKAKNAATQALNEVIQAREKAEEDVEAVRDRRAVVDAMRRLVRIQEEIDGGDKALGRAGEIEGSIESTEAKLAELDAPGKKELNGIKKRLSRLVELEADLKAAQLSLTVTPTEGGAVTLQVDRQAEESVAVTPGEVLERAVRQRVHIGIRDFGSVEVVRGAEDKSVEELASDRDRIKGELSSLLARWGVEDVERSEVIPELSRRITERESLETQVKKYGQELSETAPEGKAALQRAIQTLGKERAKLLRIHRELNEWDPSRALLAQAEFELEDDEQERREALSAGRTKENAARTQVEEAEDKVESVEAKVQEVKTELAKAEALRDSHKEEYGAEDRLVNAVEAKQKELAKKKKEFERHRLTEDEERVPEQVESAEEALRKRRERVNSLREQLAHLTGQLQSSEGLHARRVAVEQGLESAKRKYEQLAVDVDAHRMLLQLFDQVRDESVEKSIKPVSELVGGWLTEVEGPTHHQPTFDSDLSVKAISVADVGSLEVEDATSYGEREQLATLVRLAYGAVLAEEEPQVVILDDPLAHADAFRHSRMLNVIRDAARKNLQIIIMTCHPNRFDHLKDARLFDLEQAVREGSRAE